MKMYYARFLKMIKTPKRVFKPGDVAALTPDEWVSIQGGVFSGVGKDFIEISKEEFERYQQQPQ